MPSNRFEQQLRQRFEGAQMSPSPHVWEQIAREVTPPPAKERRILPIFWWAAAACIPLLIGLYLGIQTVVPESPVLTAQSEPIELQQVPEECPPAQKGEKLPHSPAQQLADNGSIAKNEAYSDMKTNSRRLPSPHPFESSVHQSISLQVLPLFHASTVPRKSARLTQSLEPALTLKPEVQKPQLNEITISNSFNTNPTVAPEKVIPLPLNTKTLQKQRWALGGSIQLGSQPSNQQVELEKTLPAQEVLVSSVSSLDYVELAGTATLPAAFSGVDLFAEYYLTSGLSLETGLGITRFHQPLILGASQDNLASPPSSPPPYLSNRLSYNVIEVPLLANFYVGKKKSALKLSTGLAYQRMVSKQPTLSYSYRQTSNMALEQTTQTLPVLNQHLLRLQGKIQYQYQFNEKMAFFAGPIFTYNLSSVLTQPLAQEEISDWAYGLEIGLKWFM